MSGKRCAQNQSNKYRSEFEEKSLLGVITFAVTCNCCKLTKKSSDQFISIFDFICFLLQKINYANPVKQYQRFFLVDLS